VRQHGDFRGKLHDASRAVDAARSAGEEVDEKAVSMLKDLLRELVDHELSEVRLFQRSVVEGWSRSD
jgi:hypothetical protein